MDNKKDMVKLNSWSTEQFIALSAGCFLSFGLKPGLCKHLLCEWNFECMEISGLVFMHGADGTR